MKHKADKGRSDRSFTVGDYVYLKLQPYVQISVATRANHKLSFKFFGPYKVLQKIGNAAYKLELPSSALVHPVFHVSQLKKSVKPSNLVSATLPTDTACFQFPHQVMDHRIVSRGGSDIHQVLVKWSGSNDALATWEDEVALRLKFPEAPAWGQADSQGGGGVSTASAGDHKHELGPRPRKPNPRVSGVEWVK
jgi:hypothetical protein